MHPRPTWQETYVGGSPEEERRMFGDLARDILDVQLRTKKKAKAGEVQRAFHAKALLGVENARLQILPDDRHAVSGRILSAGRRVSGQRSSVERQWRPAGRPQARHARRGRAREGLGW